MNIVVVDAYPLNTGDLSWEGIRALGKLTIYDRTPANQITERCYDADIILTNKVPFGRTAIESLPRLKLICVVATGYNIIDILVAKERGIMVCNVPGYGTASVSQHVFALLLELTNHVGENAASVKAGEWQRSEDWCYTKAPVTELEGKTMGIVGFGDIGRRVAAISNALGMKVIYYSPSKKNSSEAVPVSLENLFAQSDVITLHCPLTAENKGFVNARLIQSMKPSAYLVNTARGQLIDEQALADALNQGIIAGAALDVLSAEPPQAGNPLLAAQNCIITPHNAWISREARERIMKTTINNISTFLDGNPVNVVNK